MERIFAGLTPDTADLVLLILASQGIPAHIRRQADGIDILTPPEKASPALSHVRAYYRENRHQLKQAPTDAFPASSFYAPPVFIIMAVLAAVHWLAEATGTHSSQVMAFGASSLFIHQGETFRAVTALFLHSGVKHLLGNLAGLLMFGAPLVSLAGYGVGPLLLLAGGTGGNLINAWLHGNALLSIGASTAVMGAAGSLVAFQVTRPDRTLMGRRITPFFAAATLVAMLSHGENTDVTAHVFGFFAGLAAGLIMFPLLRVFRSPKLQLPALGLTLLILVTAVVSGVLAPHFDW